MIGQKKVEIFSRKFHKSLAKHFLEVAIKKLLVSAKKSIIVMLYGYLSGQSVRYSI
jgi:hypothetical protein